LFGLYQGKDRRLFDTVGRANALGGRRCNPSIAPISTMEAVHRFQQMEGGNAEGRTDRKWPQPLTTGASSQSGENTQFGPFPLCICGRFGRTLKRLAVGAIHQCELLHTRRARERPWKSEPDECPMLPLIRLEPQSTEARLLKDYATPFSRPVPTL
jgi:hypothetical protein